MTATKDFFKTRPPNPSDFRRAKLARHNNAETLSDWQPATLKWYNMSKGFGFVTLPDGQEAFLHATVFRSAGFIRYAADMPVQVRIYPLGPRLRVGDIREA